MKKEIEIKPKKPKLAYVGMDKKTLTEAVPAQVRGRNYVSPPMTTIQSTMLWAISKHSRGY